MTDETPVAPSPRDTLLKKIDGKLAWICFFLILITLNTCSLEDRVGDAIREMRDGDGPAGSAAPEVATPVAAQTAPAPSAPAT